MPIGFQNPLNIAFIVGEASGDYLGARLITRLRDHNPLFNAFGIAGPEMVAVGCRTIFAMDEIDIVGPLAILAQLRRLTARIKQAADEIISKKPDALVIIDCPEFSHRVAKKVRKHLPDCLIINYVAPTVWAWRPGRAKAMIGTIDHIMALLPFEPECYARLGGPPCSYVGHPAIERPPPSEAVIKRVREQLPDQYDLLLVVMPGSRLNELRRICGPFGDALSVLVDRGITPAVVLPTLPYLLEHVNKFTKSWQIQPIILTDSMERSASLHIADSALVASGTATLELALSNTPMVVGYRTERLLALGRRFILVHSIVLANLIHGGTPIPEFFQSMCNGKNLANEIIKLIEPGPQRQAQLDAFGIVKNIVKDNGVLPSERAAQLVLKLVEERRT